jgi:hypothetical protein
MVRRSYPGLLDPRARIDALRPYRNELIEIAGFYRPGGAEYMQLMRAVAALDDCCLTLFNDRSHFHEKGRPIR